MTCYQKKVLPRTIYLAAWTLLAIVLVPNLFAADAPLVPLGQGDHICILGNALAERMNHHGWLETLLQAQFPKHELVIRNLGHTGDEINGFSDKQKRLRNMDAGSFDAWLFADSPVPQPNKLSANAVVSTNRFQNIGTQPDVLLAFYGYNESWADAAGIGEFKDHVAEFIKHVKGKKYNGKNPPRLVLFSPVAHELLDDANLPSSEAVDASNARLKLYSEAMAEVSKTQQVTFVDLFTPTHTAFTKGVDGLMVAGQRLNLDISGPYTINGIHLNENGDRLVAQIVLLSILAPQQPLLPNPQTLQRLRDVVNEKNAMWFQRYLATDGYSVYGDRAFLKFKNEQSNYEVGQRELEVLDVMVENRDQRIWAASQGKEQHLEDDNLPAFLPVETNKPGDLPGGKHAFLDPGEASISKMKVPPEMKVSLFACEQQFPELVKPVQISFDTKGRLWVACWKSYPHWKPTEAMDDKLVILEDTDHDGVADKCTTFANDLHNPTGFEFWGDGVFVAQGPDLLFLRDTNGDDKYDTKERVLTGFDTADTHHMINSFTLSPGGDLFMQEGTFMNTQVETPYGAPVRNVNAGVYRYNPRTKHLDVYAGYGFANPHGHAFDDWGQDFIYDGTMADPYHGSLISGHVDFPNKHKRAPLLYRPRTRPCSGIEILSSRLFPAELQGNLLVNNVIGVQGVLQYRLAPQGSSYHGTEVAPLLTSTDPNFRPADIEVGPDGAVYFTDWQNPIIGHMQHNLRDPSRDATHGRVYRITVPGKPLLKPPTIAGESVEKLLDLLKEPEYRTRYRTRIELSDRSTSNVTAALKKWIAKLDPKDATTTHHLLEALWMYQHHNVVNEELLNKLLASDELRARAAAVKVLCAWRDRVDGSLEILRRMASDSAPLVRMEVVRAASYYRVPEAMEIPAVVETQPLDNYLGYVIAEARQTLNPIWKKAVASKQAPHLVTEAGKRYWLRTLPLGTLLKGEKSREACLELLSRRGVEDADRRAALAALAKLDKKSEIELLTGILAEEDPLGRRDDSVLVDLMRLLTTHSPKELTSDHKFLENLAISAKKPLARQVGYVSLLLGDKGVETAWSLAAQKPSALTDLLTAVPLVSDPLVRGQLYPNLIGMLKKLPATIESALAKDKGKTGRYVRIELTGRVVLTLAEVEVLSEGRNVAQGAQAKQSSTDGDAIASRAVDGNKSGRFADGGQSATLEKAGNDPWWEVDLGKDMPIESIVVYGRTEEQFRLRLENFTIRVLDGQRKEVFAKTENPAPEVSATFTLADQLSATQLRSAAMQALTYVRGKEGDSVKLLAELLSNAADRDGVIAALLRIPAKSWPADSASPVVQKVMEYVRSLPTEKRSTATAMDAMQLVDSLAGLLPEQDARTVRRELGELGVRVVKVSAVPHEMAFDKEQIAIAAGKPVHLIFENHDIMLHNFVVTEPGFLEKIGGEAEAGATDPTAIERHYVPKSKQVVLSSILLQPQQSQALDFTAPTAEGVYPYVCTYPGHWRRMYGAMVIVTDLEGYLANPTEYMKQHSLEVKDDLLKYNRPRTQWKLADFADAPSQIEHGRNLAQAKKVFQIASCAACHKLNGVGNALGPDLAQLDAQKFKPADIVRDILEPSHRINEKFQTVVVQTEEGQIVSGLITAETKDEISIVENPLANCDPVKIRRDDIDENGIVKKDVSLMPQGLLDKLTREEILDLLAYVNARGKEDDAAFEP
jgi:putative heme-binding domain-containing protein